MRQISLLIITLFFVVNTYSTVWVYNYPDTIISIPDTVIELENNHYIGENIRSPFYRVQVVQNDEARECYVMRDYNQSKYRYPNNTSYNHWTNFSRTGHVQLKIIRTDGNPISFCKVYPLKKGYIANVVGDTATIEVPEQAGPLHLYIEMNDAADDPLFIFCDPQEVNPPVPSDTSVLLITTDMTAQQVKDTISNTLKPIIYFEKGVHRWENFIEYKCNSDGTRCQDCMMTKGYQMPIIDNKHYYFPGGSYVQGSFHTESASNAQFTGRGILSGCGLSSIESIKGIPFNLININGGNNQKVEGLILLDAPHFNIIGRGDGMIVDNVKMLSWWISTDGVGCGNNAQILNTFYKVNDDNIKLYWQNNIVDNTTIYHQVVGAPFQFAWSGQNGNNNTVTNTYIVNSSWKDTLDVYNTAVINMMRLNTNRTYTNNNWDGLYIENGCHRLLGMNAYNNGTFENWNIKNVELNQGNKPKPQHLFSYLNNGNFNGIHFKNFTINGDTVHFISESSDTPGYYWCTGEVGGITFNENATTQYNLEDSFQFLPSTQKGVFTLYLSNYLQNTNACCNIYSSKGNKVFCQRINTKSKEINLSDLPKGVYVFCLSENKSQISRKFVVH